MCVCLYTLQGYFNDEFTKQKLDLKEGKAHCLLLPAAVPCMYSCLAALISAHLTSLLFLSEKLVGCLFWQRW
jgi:hypothetical protein